MSETPFLFLKEDDDFDEYWQDGEKHKQQEIELRHTLCKQTHVSRSVLPFVKLFGYLKIWMHQWCFNKYKSSIPPPSPVTFVHQDSSKKNPNMYNSLSLAKPCACVSW